MKTWVIVLLVVLALLLLGTREGFEATATIKDPLTWDDAEYERIRNMVTPKSTELSSDIKEIVGGFFSTWRDATSRITLNQVTSYISSKGVAEDKRGEYTQMVKAYYIDQGQSVFQQAAGYVASYTAAGGATQDPIEEARRAREAATRGGGTTTPPPVRVVDTPATEEYANPICPSGTSLNGQNKCQYPEEAELPTCPSGYTMTSGRRCRKQGGTEEVDPICPSGKIFDNAEVGWGCIRPFAASTCPSGYTLRSSGLKDNCVKPVSGVTNPGVGTSAGTSEGNTTGGASTTSFGPNSGSGTGGAVWGPAFTSFGSLLGGDTGDSTTTTQYPILLGGITKPSTRLDGVGITEPSSSWQLSLSGQLPSMDSLGANAGSQFLPYSRTPGDQDIIPDPFRVSQQFSAASYSSRQEPAPFLTDFSAFLA
jgi:hypothetical protein